ncbi:MAG: radical SAM protein [Methanomassiliicoccales archaeon]|nr:MAG: radical SAM protein [Methanomassiliicoccales archaeon]
MKSVYGPIRSWRVGAALGVDPICRQPKVCNLKCVYCRLGHGGMMITDRCRFVDEKQVVEEAREILNEEDVDAVEIRGTGEPFLARNLGMMARSLRALTDVPICVITNGSMLQRKDVMDELEDFDVVIVKLDASDEKGFYLMNRPHSSIRFDDIVKGAIKVKAENRCDIRVQVTFVQANMYQAEEIARTCEDIGVEMVYLSTPIKIEGQDLTKRDIIDLSRYFRSFKVRTIFDDDID